MTEFGLRIYLPSRAAKRKKEKRPASNFDEEAFLKALEKRLGFRTRLGQIGQARALRVPLSAFFEEIDTLKTFENGAVRGTGGGAFETVVL